MYDTTVCCSNRQLRVKPMNSGVDSVTCGEGGLFHSGIGGRSEGDIAFAARGKLSVMGRGASGSGFRIGFGFSRGSEGPGLRNERLSLSLRWRRRVVRMKRGMNRRQILRRRSMAK